MTTTESTTSAALPAAWYRDPSGRHERRWWDGNEWSDKVADGEDISSDPPFRTPAAATTTEPAHEQAHEDVVEQHVVEDAHDAAVEDQVEDEDPMAGFDELGKARVPIEHRPTTAPMAGKKIERKTAIVGAVVLAIVAASLWWGVSNQRTAAQWKDRGEELQEELVTVSSNADAIEQALERSASRGARLQDGQQTFIEVQDAAQATARQLSQCVNDVSALIDLLALGSDPTAQIDRANQSCGQASFNSQALIDILDAIAEQ